MSMFYEEGSKKGTKQDCSGTNFADILVTFLLLKGVVIER
jgi:hypothetical protein